MSLESWKEWVIQLRQECSARKKSAHLTEETECLSSAWPTATARDWKGCGNAVDRKDGKHRLDTLEAVAIFGLPAPDKSSSTGSRQESWRTPTTKETEGGQASEKETRDACPTVKLRYQVEGAAIGRQNTARLNPDWVCTLMGVPVGWVSVNDEGKNRIDELRLLGNGVVPQTAEKAFVTLWKEIEKCQKKS